ncbi:Adenine/guanine permease AZG1 [Morella rubra]|uniref:Adenine/guanine permease AZG1 n=1 Tax=Morella rubra TaxID=262757 RepID=A0A6A1WDQ4_9ROSI|nr:Adenine/guanine permease AZG1 [Morella rubra]
MSSLANGDATLGRALHPGRKASILIDSSGPCSVSDYIPPCFVTSIYVSNCSGANLRVIQLDKSCKSYIQRTQAMRLVSREYA